MVTVTSCTNHGLIAVWYGRGWRWWWWQGPTDPLTIMPVVFEGINDSHPTVFLFSFLFFLNKQTNKQTNNLCRPSWRQIWTTQDAVQRPRLLSVGIFISGCYTYKVYTALRGVTVTLESVNNCILTCCQTTRDH